MMNFIWDIDGTLLDSYTVIVNSLHEVYLEIGIDIKKEEILKEVISESVSYFIDKVEKEYGISFESLKARHKEINRKELLNIKSMEHAKDILEFINNNGMNNFIYSHRGETTELVLKNNDIYHLFKEIVTSLNGFKRKPDREGIDYLVNKYHLNRNETYYVGDRIIDIECACNAEIKSIMYIPSQSVAISSGNETYLIKDLLEIKDIINQNK